MLSSGRKFVYSLFFDILYTFFDIMAYWKDKGIYYVFDKHTARCYIMFWLYYFLSLNFGLFVNVLVYL